MSNYWLDFNTMQSDDTGSIRSMLNIVGFDDHLIISLKEDQAVDTRNLFRIIEDNGFTYGIEKGKNDGKYNIIVRRR